MQGVHHFTCTSCFTCRFPSLDNDTWDTHEIVQARKCERLDFAETCKEYLTINNLLTQYTSDVQSRVFVVEPHKNFLFLFLFSFLPSYTKSFGPSCTGYYKSTYVKPASKWCTLECRGKTLQYLSHTSEQQDSQWLIELKSYVIL